MNAMPNYARREEELALTYPPNHNTVSEPLEYLEENGSAVARFRHHVLSEAGWLPVIRYVVTYDRTAAHAPKEFIAKWQTPHGQNVGHLLLALWNAGFDGREGFAISQPFGYITSKNILLQGQARGAPLYHALNRSPADVKQAERAGQWLAKFHGTHGLPVFGPSVQEEIARITDCAHQVARRVSARSSRVLDLATEVERIQWTAATARVPTHGDYHPKNIYIDRDLLTVIDFDRFAMSHRERDLGFFMAQSMTMPRRPGKTLSRARAWNAAFLEGYARNAQSPHPTLLCSYIVSALLEVLFYKLCVRPMTDLTFVGDWLGVCEKLLARRTILFA